MKNLVKILLILIIIVSIVCIPPLVIQLPSTEFNSSQDSVRSSDIGEFINLDGILVYVEDLNSSSDKVITFIHGFGGSTYSWRNNKQYFAENGFRVILMDLKGFGLSQKGVNLDYSHGSQADLVKGVLDYLQVRNTILVGHSMGGNIATVLTQKYPDMVTKLVLVDAAVNDSAYPGISKALGVFPFQNWAEIIANAYFTKDRFESLLQSAYLKSDFVTEDILDNYYRPLKIKGWQGTLVGIIRDSSQNTLPGSLSTLTKPTLILWGDKDPWINISKGTDLNAKIVNSAFIKIDNSGHLPMEENPDSFNSILLDYVNGL